MPGHHAIAFDDLLDCSLIEDLVKCYAKSHLDNPFTSCKAPPMQVEERFWFDWMCPEIARQARLLEEREMCPHCPLRVKTIFNT